MAKPWTCTRGVPVPRVLLLQCTAIPPTCSRSVTQPASVTTAGSSHEHARDRACGGEPPSPVEGEDRGTSSA